MDTIYISFLWHMHQPYYKNLYTGDYLLPWVLLHGTKDYFDMAYILKNFDGLKQNFNLVPSLLAQLKDYENLEAKDTYLAVFRKEPQDLTAQDRTFILKNFFNANWEYMIKPFPRYYELLRKRGFHYPKEGIQKIQGYFTNEDLRDIQVLFFLAWIDPVFYEDFESLRFLKSKGKAFSEDDKRILEDTQKAILKGIIPLYKEMAATGAIEVSTSPFYHPIVPLLIDNRVAREAMSDVPLPTKVFARPEDASAQIQKAIDLFMEIFQVPPKGMWPPEGSVSDAALQLYIDHGVTWVATDEDILFQSLGVDGHRDPDGFTTQPELLYKPYRFETKRGGINVVFRDQALSDLISFHYAKSDPKEAADDCIRRIKAIGDGVRGRVRKPLVTIAMDGENAWENYRNDGRDFLSFLYEGILKDGNIQPVTISGYLEDSGDVGSLPHIFAGSWIGHNFSIWIGQTEDNTGWSLLAETRDFLEGEDPDRKHAEAWESIYAAEGSDWFWWYGDEHSSDDDEVFDYLFRENLANAYRFVGKEPPDILSIPILTEDREVKPTMEPINFIYPKIDGKVTDYFDWMGAGYIEGKGHGTAMHESVTLIKGCYFGFNERALVLRTDIDKYFIQSLKDVSFEINLLGPSVFKIVYHLRRGKVESALPVTAVFRDILEMEIPLSALKVKKGEKINLWFSLKAAEMLVDRVPNRGYLTLAVPSENFETEMWYV
jgi:alpha-amylase/alpha-mannosidase (GH57 family)